MLLKLRGKKKEGDAVKNEHVDMFRSLSLIMAQGRDFKAELKEIKAFNAGVARETVGTATGKICLSKEILEAAAARVEAETIIVWGIAQTQQGIRALAEETTKQESEAAA